MDRINVNTLDPTNPLAVLNPGARRGWQNQDLSQGLAGTIPNAEFLNPAQEELMALEEGVGISPSAIITDQVRQGLLRLFGGNYTLVEASVTLTADQLGDVLVDATNGAVTITLPAAAAIAGTVAGASVTNPARLRLWRRDTTSNTVLVNAAAADTILTGGGSSSQLKLPAPGGWNLWSDGASEWVAAQLGPAQHGSAFFGTAGAADWTCPVGVFFVEVEAWNGGAGGGGGGNGFGGGGGAGGAYVKAVVPVVPNTTYSNIVGDAGAGGAGGTASTVGTAGSSPTTQTAVYFSGGSMIFSAPAGGPGGGTGAALGGGGVTISGLGAGVPLAVAGGDVSGGASATPGAGALGIGALHIGDGGAGGTASTGNGYAGNPGAIYLRW